MTTEDDDPSQEDFAGMLEESLEPPEFSESGKNMVVSRRALLEAEEAERAQEVRGTIVAAVQSYGAFVDLGGGIQGLLHVSEMGWSRVSDPNEVVQPGDEITVKVLRVEDDGKKIALGLKQLAEQKREAQAYAQSRESETASGFGTMADKLRSAMRRRN